MSSSDSMEYAVEIKIELTYYVEATGQEEAAELATAEAVMDISDSTAEIEVTNIDFA